MSSTRVSSTSGRARRIHNRSAILAVVALLFLLLSNWTASSIHATLRAEEPSIALMSAGSTSAFCDSVSQIPTIECEALEALYDSTNGANWTNNDGWMVSDTPCSWYGIQCAADHVTAISLNENQLQGTIPSELRNLGQLGYLSIFLNQLTGSIPVELGDLGNLTWLDLGDNQLTGNIPTSIGNLTNLYGFWAGNNQLDGSIPTEFGNLTSLHEVWLQGNQLSGNIPTELGYLDTLIDLRVSGNPMSGILPMSLVNLSQIQILHFGDTHLCEPNDPAFQAWLMGIPDLWRTGACTQTFLPLTMRNH